jgi:hypothetical protein
LRPVFVLYDHLARQRVTVAAQPMDTGAAPDLLLRAADNPAGWRTMRGAIAALERHEIKSLERPIEAWEATTARTAL